MNMVQRLKYCWFKPQAGGQALTEEEIAFLAVSRTSCVQTSRQFITHNVLSADESGCILTLIVDDSTHAKIIMSLTDIVPNDKARESKPKLYDGNTILKMDTIVIPDSDETLELSEESPQSQAKDTVIVKLKEKIKSLKWNGIESTSQNGTSGLVIAALKNELRKLKGKALDNEDTVTHSVDPKVSKDNMEPITPKLLNKRTAHSSYIKHTQEELGT
ncbi:hypothetical protein Tco_0472889 [Tanacetum coccineum]